LYDIFGNSGDSRKAYLKLLYVSGLYHSFYNRVKILLDFWQNFLFTIAYKYISKYIILSTVLPKCE